MEAPIQDFSRYVGRDYDLDGVSLPEGSRAIIFYGAANRDPRQFRNPDRFESARQCWASHGIRHRTAHMPWHEPRKLEMRALFIALARKVKRFHIEAEERVLNNVLRGFSKLIVTVEISGVGLQPRGKLKTHAIGPTSLTCAQYNSPSCRLLQARFPRERSFSHTTQAARQAGHDFCSGSFASF